MKMKSCTQLSVLVSLLLIASSHGAKTQLALSAGNSYMNFRFDIPQRCYSLDSCYDDKGTYASWLALKDSARIALYTESECVGDHVTVDSSPRGSLKLAEVGFDKKVSSFMLWETGTFAINGYIDICHGHEYADVDFWSATEGEDMDSDAGITERHDNSHAYRSNYSSDCDGSG